MNSKTVYRLKVQGEEGITFDVDSKTTLYNVMDFVCENWLDIIRDGDGRIDDHLWRIFKPLPPEPDYSTLGSDEAWEDAWDEYYEAEEQAENGLPQDITLEELTWFRPGNEIKVEYDYGTTTSFDILFLSEEKMNSRSDNNDCTATNLLQLPTIVPSAADMAAKSFVPYQPPENSPNLDTIFPHANQLMFASGDATWVCPYPCSETSAGFIEGGFRYGSDIVFMPIKFSGIFEALIAIDLAMKQYPQKQKIVVGDGGISRMAFPLKMTKAKEEKFLAYEKDINEYAEFLEKHPDDEFVGPNGIDFNKFEKLVPKKHQYRFFCPDREAVVRVTEENMQEYHHYDDKSNINFMAQFFPLCTKAYDVGLWASYRRGKVIVSQGNDTGERGEPKEILAQVSQHIVSLHQFFCVCEALFQQVEAGSKFEAIKRLVQTNPNYLVVRRRTVE